MIVNPDRGYDRDANERNPNYSPTKPDAVHYETQKLIAVFQMTYRGAPMIYYGDEVGMWGADDPHDRKPMIWDELKYDDEVITNESGFKKGFGRFKVEQNREPLNFYKRLAHLRKSNLALRKGTLNILYSNDEKKSFVFERKEKDGWFVIAFNSGDISDKISLYFDEQKISYEELLSGEKGSFTSKNKLGVNFEYDIPSKTAFIYQIHPHNN